MIPFAGSPIEWNNGTRRILSGVVPLSWLKPATYNPRTISDESRARLKAGLDHFGLVDPYVVTEDGTLLGGHQRLAVETARGTEAGLVIVVHDLSADEQRALNVLLNNPNAQGAWDLSKLGELLSDLDGNGFDATLTGFSEEELESLLTAPPSADTGDLEPSDDRYEEQYAVIVLCTDEGEQEATYNRLRGLGLNCRVVNT